MDSPASVYVGCAGWNLPVLVQDQFPVEGTHLRRYAQRLPAVEIHSSFYRPHRYSTYQRWADSTPAEFRFSVKAPRRITHELRLTDLGTELQAFLESVAGLGEKLGCLLIQLPPSLACDQRVAEEFFRCLREATETPAVLEPRHRSWFTESINALLAHYRIGRVAADPPRAAADATPGGDRATIYYRLHGSPRTYYSSYDSDYLKNLAEELLTAQAESRRCWCIFDNTASGAAWQNALELRACQASLTFGQADQSA